MRRPLTHCALLVAAVVGLASYAGRAPRGADPGLRIAARPDPSARPALPEGTTTVRLSNGQDGLLHVPAGEVRGLVVSLHGAGGNARHGLDLFHGHADRLGLVVLAPASAGRTWSAILGGPDPDTPALDAALKDVLDRQPVDPARVAVSGFSDGASYALTLGLANGDLFPSVLAFSPGFEAADQRRGTPELFVTHGVHDEVLPIDRTSRRLVRSLRQDGYAVVYREFDGPHAVPVALSRQGADWLLR